MTNVVDVIDYAAQADELSNEIEALENTRAPLWAVYGPGGTWEAERKISLSMCAGLVRLASEGVKITEAAVDQQAHDHPAYVQCVVAAEQDRTQMALLDAEINAKTRRYELARARLYLTGRLAGLQ